MKKWTVLVVGIRVLLVGGWRVASVRRHWGCPVPDTTGSSELQLTHRRSCWTLQPKGSALGKRYLRKGKSTPQADQEGMTRLRNSSGNSSQGRKWRRCSRHQSRYSPAAWGGTHTAAHGYLLKAQQLVESPHLSRGKVWGEVAETKHYVLTITPHAPVLLIRWWLYRSPKEWNWALEKGEETCCYSICLFLSHYSNLFQLAMKYIDFAQVKSTLPMTLIIGSCFILTRNFSHPIFSLLLSEWASGWAHVCYARLSHHKKK